MPGVRSVDLPGEGQSHARPDRLISALAGCQHGVVARRQLLERGLTTGQIEGRLAGGLLHPIHRGVYAVGIPHMSLHGRWLGAVLACGPRATLSHRSAGALHGLLRAHGPCPQVTVPERGGRNPPGIRVFRTRQLPEADRTAVSAIPVTSVPRTLLDLAATLDADALARAFEEADRLGLLQLADLFSLRAGSHGRRGLRAFDAALAAHTHPPDVRSELEWRFFRLCRLHDIPPPALNVLLEGHSVDCLWQRERVVVELDGYGYHRTRAAHERDHQRDVDLALAGFAVHRFSYRQVLQHPERVAALVKKALGSA